MNNLKKILAVSTLTAGFATLASAQVLMLNFRSSDGPSGVNLTNSPYHTANPGFTDTTWNNVSNSDVASGLLWADGSAASGVGFDLGLADLDVSTTVNLSTAVGSASNLGGAANTGVYSGNSIGTGGIFSGSSADRLQVGLQVTGLSAGIYEVFVTGRNTNSGGDGDLLYSYYASEGTAGNNFDFSGYASGSVTFTSQTDAVSSWVETGNANANYAKFTVTIASGEAINIVSNGDGGKGGDANRGFLNSVQISAIPEPHTWAMIFGTLAFGIVLIRRKFV